MSMNYSSCSRATPPVAVELRFPSLAVEAVDRIPVPSALRFSTLCTRLAGQELWVRERRPGPPPTYYLVTASVEGFAVPVWMTQRSAGELRFEC